MLAVIDLALFFHLRRSRAQQIRMARVTGALRLIVDRERDASAHPIGRPDIRRAG